MSNSGLRVLHVTPEIAPFSKTGGLGDVSAALPKALAAIGCEVDVLTPLYSGVRGLLKGCQAAAAAETTIDGQRFALEFLPFQTDGGPTIYFLKCDRLYNRAGMYVDPERDQDYDDNNVRFLVLCRAAFNLCSELDWIPAIFHSHDWQTGLVPYLLRYGEHADRYRNSRSVFTIHNMAYQGLFPRTALDRIPQSERFFSLGGPLEFHGLVSYLKAALEFSDAVNTVSPTYANEVRSSHDYGFGMENVLAHCGDRFTGILNGIDTQVWNPETDARIAVPYSRTTVAKKEQNKKALCKALGLPFKKDLPLIGMISRITDQKGFEIIVPVLADIIDQPAQLVVLGTGDPFYEHVLLDFARLFPNKIHVVIAYDEALAHQIEAGADLFLMPSRFEPSGLTQMMSMRYGTLPIVRATGGLADTVIDADEDPGNGTGFSFIEYSSETLLATIRRAIAAFHDRGRWRTLQRRVMKTDFSWERSARAYLELYRDTLERPPRRES